MNEHDNINTVDEDEFEYDDSMIVFETDCCVPYENK